MKSLWSDQEAAEFLAQYGSEYGDDLALRVYTSRLIGRDADLVLHGGGNTSVKTRLNDILGESVDVLCVKGSGWDLVDIEPPGLPALKLEPLLRLEQLDSLSDEDMVNQVRTCLLDAAAPNPSVEALLHAFLPHRFVDHTHADAILVLTNQPSGDDLVRAALGARIVLLPWIMPGFPLARAVASAYREQPDCEGVVLLKHGLFTFGDDARSSYERMIELVDRAECYVRGQTRGKVALLDGASDGAPCRGDAFELVDRVLPIVRGSLALSDEDGDVKTRFVAEWRGADDLVRFSLHADAAALVETTGPLTPDHVLRTKGSYLVLSRDEAGDPARCRARVTEYAESYRAYFESHQGRMPQRAAMLDPHPRVVVVEGGGILAFGQDKRAALIAADIAEHTVRAKARGEAIGKYAGLDPGDLFDMEYWSLEQAKLGRTRPPLLAGQVALITGAAGAIGHGIAEALLGAGAHVVLTDRDADGLERVQELLEEDHAALRLRTFEMDVTDPARVDAAFRFCCRTFGGVDLVVPNAGLAYASDLADMDLHRFRQVVEVNLCGTMNVLKVASRLFELQGTGGSVVLQSSKNVFDPGAGFGAYSASKAAAHQLGRIAALELAPLGVRVNMINADAVFGDQIPSGLWAEVGPARMRARGLDPEGLRQYYRNRSLLKKGVTPRHVGEAVVFLAGGLSRTTGATLPVDAGIPAAFPR